jgi:hypothetical protein
VHCHFCPPPALGCHVWAATHPQESLHPFAWDTRVVMRLRSSFQHSKIPVPLHKVSYSANNMQRTKPPSMGGLLHAVPRVACLLTSHARPHRSASCVHAQQHLSADVAIVGAGPGGLAAAHAIAAAAPQLQVVALLMLMLQLFASSHFIWP